jgi:hypothetical protein
MNRTEIENRLKENKADRKYLKKQLAELPEFEVKNWYKSASGVVAFFNNEKESMFYGYGISRSGNWFNEDNFEFNMNAKWVLMTETEVFEALKNEAIKREFKEYMTENFLCLDDGAYWSDRDEFSFENNKFGLGANIIMKNGKWATIIKEPTIELNGEYTKVQLTDIINNRF